MFTRKATPQDPAAILEQLRDAQAQHAQAVAAANAELVANHESAFQTATDRKSTLQEQISLLQAESAGLDKVIDTADPAKVQRAGQ